MAAVKLADKLLAKLQRAGLTKKKATVLAKKLSASSAARQPVRGTVTGKLTGKLYGLGLSKRRAEELAKILAPTVRAAIKAKAKKAKLKLDDVDDQMVEDTVSKTVDEAEDEELDKVAPRIDGVRIRLDLPVVTRSMWQRSPFKGIQLLRVIDGLTTSATYLSAAVKGEQGIVAVRQFSTGYYNCKFYPDMAYWKRTPEQLYKLGATDHLKREWYERVHVSRDTLDTILKGIEKENKPFKTRLLQRLLSVTGRTLVKAFDYLHKRIGYAA